MSKSLFTPPGMSSLNRGAKSYRYQTIAATNGVVQRTDAADTFQGELSFDFRTGSEQYVSLADSYFTFDARVRAPDGTAQTAAIAVDAAGTVTAGIVPVRDFVNQLFSRYSLSIGGVEVEACQDPAATSQAAILTSSTMDWYMSAQAEAYGLGDLASRAALWSFTAADGIPVVTTLFRPTLGVLELDTPIAGADFSIKLQVRPNYHASAIEGVAYTANVPLIDIIGMTLHLAILEKEAGVSSPSVLRFEVGTARSVTVPHIGASSHQNVLVCPSNASKSVVAFKRLDRVQRAPANSARSAYDYDGHSAAAQVGTLSVTYDGANQVYTNLNWSSKQNLTIPFAETAAACGFGQADARGGFPLRLAEWISSPFTVFRHVRPASSKSTSFEVNTQYTSYRGGDAADPAMSMTVTWLYAYGLQLSYSGGLVSDVQVIQGI